MVTKGWFRVSIGVILLSASMVSIFFSRSHELPPACLLHQHVAPFQICRHVYLQASGDKSPDSAGPLLAPSLRSVLCSSILISWSPFPAPRRLCLPCGGRCHGSSLPAGHGCSLCRRGRGRLLREEVRPLGHLHRYECAGAAGSCFHQLG